MDINSGDDKDDNSLTWYVTHRVTKKYDTISLIKNVEQHLKKIKIKNSDVSMEYRPSFKQE